MLERVRHHVGSNIVGYIALFFALGMGTAWAATEVGRNSVGAPQIEKNAVKAPEIAKNAVRKAEVRTNAVTTDEVADASLLGEDFAPGQLPQGPTGPQGPPGDEGPPGPPGPSTGPAGGDLQGTYPNPKLRPPEVTSAGLPKTSSESGIVCSPGDFNGWQELFAEKDVGYYRDPFGRVHLQGMATKCGSGTPVASNRIFILPPGFRPAERGFHATMAAQPGGGGFGAFGAVVVGANGGVEAVEGNFSASTTGFISLEGISFRCGPSGANGCP